MIIGSLGDTIFEVSADVVKTFDDFEWNSAVRWAKHDRHLGETLPEFTGVDPDGISFGIYLSAFLGVDPEAEYIKLLTNERSGKIMSLAIGEKLYGKHRWVIEKSKRGKWIFINTGRPLALEVTLNLLAYPAR